MNSVENQISLVRGIMRIQNLKHGWLNVIHTTPFVYYSTKKVDIFLDSKKRKQPNIC